MHMPLQFARPGGQHTLSRSDILKISLVASAMDGIRGRIWHTLQPGICLIRAILSDDFQLRHSASCLILGGIIALGMSPEQVDNFRHKHRVAIRLITGITLLALALFIYWKLI